MNYESNHKNNENKMIDWFRSWHGAPTDPKWLLIAKRAGVKPGMVSGIVWALFDHASQNDDRGSVADFDCETYAAFSGYEEEEVRAVYAVLEAKSFIISGRIAKWDKRQPRREDSGSTERSRKLRGNKTDAEPTLPLEQEPVPEPVVDVSAQKTESAPEKDVAPENGASPCISPEAMVLADKIAVIAGHDLQFVPPSWCGAAARVHMWLQQGWHPPLILESVKAQMVRKRDGPPDFIQYFEKGIQREHDRAFAPLPTVVPFEPSKVRHGKAKSPIIASIDQIISDLEADGSEVRQDSAGLLSDRGS